MSRDIVNIIAEFTPDEFGFVDVNPQDDDSGECHFNSLDKHYDRYVFESQLRHAILALIRDDDLGSNPFESVKKIINETIDNMSGVKMKVIPGKLSDDRVVKLVDKNRAARRQENV